MKQMIRVGFAGAAAKILSVLGRKTAGEIVGRSPSLVYKWSDPNLCNNPTVTQALEMDVEYVRNGYGSPPFLTAYSELLNSQLQQRRQLPRTQFVGETVRLLEEAVALVKTAQERKCTEENGAAGRETAFNNIQTSLRNCRNIVANLAWSLEVDKVD